MDNNYIRALVALVLAVLLWSQAQRIIGQPWRKRAFQLAAGGMAALAGYNAAVASGGNGLVPTVMLVVVGLLFVAAAGALVLVWRNGELQAGRKQFQAAMRAEGVRRKQAVEEQKSDDKR